MMRVLTTAAAMAMLALPAQALVMNGNFETVDDRVGIENGNTLDGLAGAGGSSSWDVFNDLPGGWTNANVQPLSDPPSPGAGIEVQTQNTVGQIDAHSGNHYIELDSDASAGTAPATNSRMEQDFEVTVAGLYQLLFFYSPRSQDVNTNGISYNVYEAGDPGNTLLLPPGAGFGGAGQVTGPMGETAVGTWTPISAFFNVDDVPLNGSLTLTLAFQAFGGDDTIGGFIDSVRIRGEDDPNFGTVPLPAPALLLLAGLGSFVLVRRRAA